MRHADARGALGRSARRRRREQRERRGLFLSHRTVEYHLAEASAKLVARHGPHGITIPINDTGTGTAVSIGSY
jgi:hypothetical protein